MSENHKEQNVDAESNTGEKSEWTDMTKINQQDPNKEKMSYEEAGDKGKAILANFVDIWNLVEWEEGDELGDPFVKVTFYKSGRLLVENYRDSRPSEFNIDQIEELMK